MIDTTLTRRRLTKLLMSALLSAACTKKEQATDVPGADATDTSSTAVPPPTTTNEVAEVASTTSVSEPPPSEESSVCENEKLMEALRILHSACTPLRCEYLELTVLDDPRYRDILLAALSTSQLHPVHVFYPDGESDLRASFDWNNPQRASHLKTYAYRPLQNSIIYIIGRASVTGHGTERDRDAANWELSKARMAGVLNYLESDLKIQCRAFRGAWMGRQILQFTEYDANMLEIPSSVYRNDLVLNQAVHVFAVPCRNVGL